MTSRHPRFAALFAALAVSLPLVVSGLVVEPPPAAAYPASTVDLEGHGWGHGRGMGQYGALGYAVDHGWTYKQILAHYYGGTHEGTLPGGDPGFGMSVRTTDRDNADTIVTGAVMVDGEPAQYGALRVARSGVNFWEVWHNPEGDCDGGWVPLGTRNGESVGIVAASGMLTICLSDGTRTVKGTVRAAQVDNQQVTVNDLAIGDYLKGVVPRESPASWGNLGGGAGMHALRAQAVAARSYSASENRYPGVAKTCDTTSCQVYAGASQTRGGSTVSESPSTNQAVDETAGEVRLFDGTEAVARTEFSSSTGGWTAGGVFPSVADEGDDTIPNPNHTWQTKLDVATVEAKYARTGLLAVEVLQRNGLGAEGGRVTKMRLVFSSGGNVDLSGDDFRIAFGLRSNWFSVVNVPSFPYHVVTRDGGVFSFGGAAFHGSLPGIGIRTLTKDITEGPAGRGYWILGEDGGVFTFGDIPFYGSMGGKRLNRPVVGMEATAARGGYWLVAGDGGIFTFGDAPFFGSTGGMRLNQPVVGMYPSASGQGYWMVATDGGIFTFGDATFFGSTGAMRLNQPVFAMAATPSGGGYWLVARDGGIFTFGDATFQGSLPGRGVRETAVEVLPSPSGFGYLIVTAEGRVHGFGDAVGVGGPRDVGAGPAPAVGAGRVPAA